MASVQGQIELTNKHKQQGTKNISKKISVKDQSMVSSDSILNVTKIQIEKENLIQNSQDKTIKKSIQAKINKLKRWKNIQMQNLCAQNVNENQVLGIFGNQQPKSTQNKLKKISEDQVNEKQDAFTNDKQSDKILESNQNPLSIKNQKLQVEIQNEKIEGNAKDEKDINLVQGDSNQIESIIGQIKELKLNPNADYQTSTKLDTQKDLLDQQQMQAKNQTNDQNNSKLCQEVINCIELQPKEGKQLQIQNDIEIQQPIQEIEQQQISQIPNQQLSEILISPNQNLIKENPQSVSGERVFNEQKITNFVTQIQDAQNENSLSSHYLTIPKRNKQSLIQEFQKSQCKIIPTKDITDNDLLSKSHLEIVKENQPSENTYSKLSEMYDGDNQIQIIQFGDINDQDYQKEKKSDSQINQNDQKCEDIQEELELSNLNSKNYNKNQNFVQFVKQYNYKLIKLNSSSDFEDTLYNFKIHNSNLKQDFVFKILYNINKEDEQYLQDNLQYLTQQIEARTNQDAPTNLICFEKLINYFDYQKLINGIQEPENIDLEKENRIFTLSDQIYILILKQDYNIKTKFQSIQDKIRIWNEKYFDEINQNEELFTNLNNKLFGTKNISKKISVKDQSMVSSDSILNVTKIQIEKENLIQNSQDNTIKKSIQVKINKLKRWKNIQMQKLCAQNVNENQVLVIFGNQQPKSTQNKLKKISEDQVNEKQDAFTNDTQSDKILESNQNPLSIKNQKFQVEIQNEKIEGNPKDEKDINLVQGDSNQIESIIGQIKDLKLNTNADYQTSTKLDTQKDLLDQQQMQAKNQTNDQNNSKLCQEVINCIELQPKEGKQLQIQNDIELQQQIQEIEQQQISQIPNQQLSEILISPNQNLIKENPQSVSGEGVFNEQKITNFITQIQDDQKENSLSSHYLTIPKRNKQSLIQEFQKSQCKIIPTKDITDNDLLSKSHLEIVKENQASENTYSKLSEMYDGDNKIQIIQFGDINDQDYQKEKESDPQINQNDQKFEDVQEELELSNLNSKNYIQNKKIFQYVKQYNYKSIKLNSSSDFEDTLYNFKIHNSNLKQDFVFKILYNINKEDEQYLEDNLQYLTQQIEARTNQDAPTNLICFEKLINYFDYQKLNNGIQEPENIDLEKENRIFTQSDQIYILILNSLELGNNLESLCSKLASFTNLAKLEIKTNNNLVGNLGLSKLAHLTKCPNLTSLELSLRNCQIGEEGAYDLGHSLSKASKIISLNLDLQQNNISDEGGQLIGFYFANFLKLTKLNINFNQNSIKNKCISDLVENLKNCYHLSSLSFNFGSIQMDSEFFLDLNSSIKHFPKLSDIKLAFSFSQINAQCIKELGSLLSCCNNLQILNLAFNNNKISFENLLDLCSYLLKCQKLKILILNLDEK
ncbi:hypothetical protein ABPG74_006683, partial [Tetrahymena malaccensis]